MWVLWILEIMSSLGWDTPSFGFLPDFWRNCCVGLRRALTSLRSLFARCERINCHSHWSICLSISQGKTAGALLEYALPLDCLEICCIVDGGAVSWLVVWSDVCWEHHYCSWGSRHWIFFGLLVVALLARVRKGWFNTWMCTNRNNSKLV